MNETSTQTSTNSTDNTNPNIVDNALNSAPSGSSTPLTEVTSIAKEDAKNGTTTKLPTPEEMVERASISLIRNMKMLNDIVNKNNNGKYVIGRHGMNRILNAILQLPEEGIPVQLKGEQEKLAFVLGQKIIGDRFIITHYHIVEERKKMLAEAQNNATVTNNTPTEQTPVETKEE